MRSALDIAVSGLRGVLPCFVKGKESRPTMPDRTCIQHLGQWRLRIAPKSVTLPNDIVASVWPVRVQEDLFSRPKS